MMFLPLLSYEVGTKEITQTLLIPHIDDSAVSSISVIGVDSDGSGITTFLYFRQFPATSTMVIGIDLLLA